MNSKIPADTASTGLLPAVLAARLLGCEVGELEYLASAGLVPHERRPMKAGGLVAVPRLVLA